MEKFGPSFRLMFDAVINLAVALAPALTGSGAYALDPILRTYPKKEIG